MFFAGLTYGPGRFKPVWVICYAYESDFPQEFGHFLYYMKLSTSLVFETRHFFWLANPAFQFCENIALQLLVGRSLTTGVKSSPLCLDASSMLFSRSEEIQEKKLRQRSKQSPEDK
jgi:hypothetical protein